MESIKSLQRYIVKSKRESRIMRITQMIQKVGAIDPNRLGGSGELPLPA